MPFDFEKFVLDQDMSVKILPEGMTIKRGPIGPEAYSIEFSSGKDIIIKKIKTGSFLVLLFSRNQFYIQCAGENYPLTELLVKDFLDALSGQEFPVDLIWTKAFSNGANFAHGLISLLSSQAFIDAVNSGDILSIDIKKFGKEKETYRDHRSLTSLYKPLLKIASDYLSKIEMEVFTYRLFYGDIPYWSRKYEGFTFEDQNLYKKLFSLRQFFDSKDINNNTFFSDITGKFGISGFYNFCKAYLDADHLDDYYISSNLNLKDIFTDIHGDERDFQCEAFIRYLINAPTAQGYVIPSFNRYDHPLKAFCDEYKDTLKMQEQLHNRIDEKYPKNLSSLHKKLSYLCYVNQERINEENFSRHSQELKLNEMSDEGDEYAIIVPETKEDILQEANSQGNCIHTFIKAFSEGKTDLYFMRKQEDPSKSLVSIEVRNGQVRQAYRAHNRPISQEESNFIKKWAEKHNIIYSSNYQPLAVGI